jgi:aminopeptidase N
VVIGFGGTISPALHGMYASKYTHEGEAKELIMTQFESHHAREVFPCVDEPAAKATFDLTLTTETGVTVLSNLHPNSQREEDGRLVTAFATTPRMSTYLLAWVYGDLHKKTDHTAGGVEVNIWAVANQRPESLDFALEHAVKSIEFFDDYFGVPYPLPKSDHVAVPDFSSGAMENWGLVTYRETTLLADPATTTIASKEYIATVISHELSHQWFGNLVTMKWWNDLWLNESFATLMEYIAVDAIHPEWNSWLDFASFESLAALRRDAVDGVQSVQVDVHHPDEINSLFDPSIVYAKGARLMRMCQAYIGHEAFQAGLRSYFQEFAYENTEANDLWRHLSDASGKDISGLMHTWISQSGFPVLHVLPDNIRQERFFIGPHEPSSAVWPIPLGAESTEDIPAMLETKSLAVAVPDDELFNADDSAHFITNYPAEHREKLLARADLTTLNKLQLLSELTLLVRGGHAPSYQLIDMLVHYQEETAEHLWKILAATFAELKTFVLDDDRAEQHLRRLAGQLARYNYDRLGWSATIGETESDTKLRSTILGLMSYSEDSEVLSHIDSLFAAGLDTLDSEIRPIVLASIVRRTTDDTVITGLLDTYTTTDSSDLREDICAGLTSVKQPRHVELLISKLTDADVIRTQDTTRWFAYLMRNKYSREQTWRWMQDNWQWIAAEFATDKSFDYFPRYAASALYTPAHLAEYQAFFTKHLDSASLRREIKLGISTIEARIDLIERDAEKVRERLAEL